MAGEDERTGPVLTDAVKNNGRSSLSPLIYEGNCAQMPCPVRFLMAPSAARRTKAAMARRRIGQEQLLLGSFGTQGGTLLDEVAALIDWAALDPLLNLIGILDRAD